MQTTEMLKQAFNQGREIEKLVSGVDAFQAAQQRAADRVLFSLQDAFSFQQGQNTVQTLVFNVPVSDDYFASRLMLYPYVRRVAVGALAAGTTPDLVFRPTIWTNQFVSGPNAPAVSTIARCAVDALLEITSTTPGQAARRYQNTAFTASQVFSSTASPFGTVGQSNVQAYSATEYPSALIFDPEWSLPKGSTLSMRVTPLFSGERDTSFTDGLINEYQFRGVLEGFKRVR